MKFQSTRVAELSILPFQEDFLNFVDYQNSTKEDASIPPVLFERHYLNPYFVIDNRKRIRYCNGAFKRLLDYNKIDLQNLLCLDIVPKKYHVLLNTHINTNLPKKGYTPVFECEYVSKNGKIVFVEQCLFLFQRAGAVDEEIFISLRDITVQKRYEMRIVQLKEAMQEEKKKFQEALNIDKKMSGIYDLNHLVDFVVNQSSKILNAQRCSLMIYDEENKELTIRGAKGLSADVIRTARIKFGEGISGNMVKRKKPILVENIDQDKRFSSRYSDQYRTKSFMSAPLVAHNNLLGIVNISDKKSLKSQSDVFNAFDLKIFCSIVNQAGIMIENAKYYREHEYLSVMDSLSNIYNHRYFVRSINDIIKRINRYKGTVSIVMIDIDHFWEYNETYGVGEGDLLIREMGRVLKNNVRDVDIVCRYSGDEFVIVLPETTADQAKFVALKLLNLINKIKTKRNISVSIGIAGYCEGIKSSDLILKSYQALEQAKKQYHNKIYCLQ